MPEKRGDSQSVSLLAHESRPQSGHVFKLHASYQPTGNQPHAITELVKGFKEGNQCQIYWGLRVPPRRLQWQM